MIHMNNLKKNIKFLKIIYFLFIKLSKHLSRNKLTQYLKNDLNLIQKNNTPKKVLFVGSGGPLEKIVRFILKGEIITIDVDPSRNPDLLMSVSEMNFNDNVFDLVLLLEVLEHVEHPFKAASEIYRVLKPKGNLIVSTPFTFGLHEEPYDYWRFTKYGLINIFSIFKEVKVYERSGFFLTICTLLARLIKSKNLFHLCLGCLFSLIFFIFLPLINLIDKFMPESITTGYYLSGKK